MVPKKLIRTSLSRFQYYYHCFKNTHFNRIISLENGIPLPIGGVVHDVSNFDLKDLLAPDLTYWNKLFPFNKYYWVYHNTLVPQSDFNYYQVPEKYRILTMGVSSSLSHFKVANHNVKIVAHPDGFSTDRKDVINLVNDIPTLNIKITGILSQFFTLKHTLNAVIDKIYGTDGKFMHYIPIKLGSVGYQRTDFAKILNRGFSVTTISDPNDPIYMVLSMILAYAYKPQDETLETPFQQPALLDAEKIKIEREANPKIKQLSFKTLDERVSFIFHTDTHYCIYTLSDLKQIFAQGATYIDKFLAQLSQMIEDVSSIQHFDPEAEMVKDNVITEEPVIVSPSITEEEPKVHHDTTPQPIEEKVAQPVVIQDQHNLPAPSKIKQIEIAAKEKPSSKPTALPPSRKDEITSVVVNSQPIFKKVTPPRRKELITHEHPSLKTDKMIDEPTMAFIEANTKDFTPAQKERVIKNANAYKTIMIGNKSIADILNETNGLKPTQPKDLSFLKDDVADDSFLKSSIASLHSDYVKEILQRQILANMVHFNRTGTFLIGVKIETVKNKLEDYTKITFQFEGMNFKQFSQPFIIPNIRPDANFISRGSIKKIIPQRINKPICKVSPTRVALFSDYYKSTVELISPSRSSLTGIISNLLIKKNPDKEITFRQGMTVDPKHVYPLELSQMASSFLWISFHGYTLNFDIHQIPYHPTMDMWEIGSSVKGHKVFMDMKNTIHIMHGEQEVGTTDILSWISDILEVPAPSVTQWTEVGIINKNIPVGMVLAYEFGLERMLSMIGLDYDVYDRQGRGRSIPDIVRSKSIMVTFSDKVLTFPREPYAKSLIAAGLNKFDLSDYAMADLNDKNNFYNIFIDAKFPPIILTEIHNFFLYFVDPVMAELLLYMNEPTSPEGLLIRATEMLTTHSHKQSSSVTNFRTRCHGKIPAFMYNEMARQLAISNRNNNSSGKINIHPEAVLQRLIQDALTENADINNPIGAIKEMATFCYTGFGGRTAESFVVRDRQFPEDGAGVISEATVDSGNVAIKAQYSLDPNIVNLHGMEEPADLKDVQAANLLSISSLLWPGLTTNDGKRANFCNIQMSQIVAIDNNQPGRVRTTYEKVVAHLCKPPFAYMAEQDGKVLEIDDKLGMIKIEYVDGTKVALQYGALYSRYSASGMYMTQHVRVHSYIRNNPTFKQHAAIIYNYDYFMEDPYSPRLIWMLGYRAKVALIDTDGTVDDACQISSKVSKALNFKPIHDTQVVLNKYNVVHSFMDFGKKVLPITPLMTFEEFDDMMGTDDKGYDEETLNLIQQLNRATPKAGFSGVIMDIKVTYTAPLETMHPSMQKFIRYVEQRSNKQVNFSKDCSNSLPKNEPITGISKIGMVNLTDDTVIVTYYIQDSYGAKHGDKVVFGSATKSEISVVFNDPIISEDGEHEIDAKFPGLSVYNRMVPEVINIGAASLVLAVTQDKALEAFFG